MVRERTGAEGEEGGEMREKGWEERGPKDTRKTLILPGESGCAETAHPNGRPHNLRGLPLKLPRKGPLCPHTAHNLHGGCLQTHEISLPNSSLQQYRVPL